ncbi:hypothetical protein C8A05DRAFT_45657 [Staphylotrichum tortipilum]|uniref:Uncharacterized protein n=1 Tax=Staphylotrichum tortipilum TaxID=2831512 RepID=A0AAN6MI02_9PEZI|nr:hypothetical protein C8A05DRAFT_45657 [Staphylotrichum longicolle]
MTHPKKGLKALADNPDRDLPWTLESLHGFCRKEALDEGYRHLFWSLGTGSGVRCDRRAITVPIGSPGAKESFREQLVWISMRTATAYHDSRQPDLAKVKGPATVGFVVSDEYHCLIRMQTKDWGPTGLQTTRGSSGVTDFQKLLWSGVDMWSEHWNICLDYIDTLHQVKIEDLDGSRQETLHDLLFDPQGWLAKEYFVTAHRVKNFCQHIDIPLRSLQQMRRISHSNWSRLLDHAEALHGKLVDKIEMSADLLNRRDSVSTPDPTL